METNDRALGAPAYTYLSQVEDVNYATGWARLFSTLITGEIYEKTFS